MCRMLLAVGSFEMKPLLDGFVNMAADNNEKHEENENATFQHADGWGMAYLENNDLRIFKSPRACFEDDQLYDFSTLQSPLVVLHARRASRGAVVIENVHPFQIHQNHKTTAFFHNGTVYEELPRNPLLTLTGSTDSEGLFFYLLSHLNSDDLSGSFLKTVASIQDYSSINSVFCQPDRIFLLNQFKLNPLYYTMKMTRLPAATIVSSEILPNFSGADWERLSNGTLLDFRFSKNVWQTTRYQI